MSAKAFLINSERGRPTSEIWPRTQRQWSVKSTRTLELSNPEAVRQVRGQENFFLTLSADGVLCYYGPVSLTLSEPQERVVKFLLTEDLLVISIRPNSRLLRFSRVDKSELQNGRLCRTDCLLHLSIPLSALKQVDQSNQRIVIQNGDDVSVWCLKTGTQVSSVSGQFAKTVWYSSNHLLHLESSNTATVLAVENLANSQVRRCKLPAAAQLVQAQVCGWYLVLVFRNCPVQVLDLATGTLRSLGTGVPSLLLETESRGDALVSFPSGQSYLLSKSERVLELTLRRPVFTDIKELIAVLENGVCTIISSEGTILTTFSEPTACQTTAIGMNEDTWELYLVGSDGQVRIYH